MWYMLAGMTQLGGSQLKFSGMCGCRTPDGVEVSSTTSDLGGILSVPSILHHPPQLCSVPEFQAVHLLFEKCQHLSLSLCLPLSACLCLCLSLCFCLFDSLSDFIWIPKPSKLNSLQSFGVFPSSVILAFRTEVSTTQSLRLREVIPYLYLNCLALLLSALAPPDHHSDII